MTTDIMIGGLDGSSPLGFLAALGALQVLEDARPGQAALSWDPRAPFRPRLRGVDSIGRFAELVVADAASWQADPVLSFRYPKIEKEGPKSFGGLAPPIRVFRPWLASLLASRSKRAVRYAAALMTDGLPEPADPKKIVTNEALDAVSVPYLRSVPADLIVQQTAFDFTSRNTQFLDQIDQIRRALTTDVVQAELEAGRPSAGDVRTMSWDAEAVVPGALFGARETRRYPATEWLAFRGLGTCRVVPTQAGVVTLGCEGRRKRGRFRWPIWEPAVGVAMVEALLGHPDLEAMSGAERRSRGICAVFSAELTKGADGYQGVFSPSSPR